MIFSQFFSVTFQQKNLLIKVVTFELATRESYSFHTYGRHNKTSRAKVVSSLQQQYEVTG
jgi:hypothetical protein